MRLRRMGAIGLLTALFLTATSSALYAQPAPVNRPSELRGGTCATPGELVTTLSNLVVAIGDPQGQVSAMPVEQSGTVVPYLVSDLLATPHIVTVLHSPEQADLVVACGEVGGTLNPDGTLAVGMIGMNGSGLTGITYFTPNPGFDNTLITTLLVGGDGAAAPDPALEPDTVGDPAPISEISATGPVS